MTELTAKEAEKLLAGVVIPPRPTVVTAVMEERYKPEPDLRRVSQLIASDVGLSAAILKTINSPLYGMSRQITSIDQAVSMLGMKNTSSIALGLSLRKAMPNAGLERFWDSAARIALISAHLASTMSILSKEDAYLFGLFHDCGIALLIQRFPDYKATLAQANSERVKAFTEIEDERHGTNHTVVGSLLASNWHLPESIREAISCHHDLHLFQSNASTDIVNLVSIGLIAEHIDSISRLSNDCEWEKHGAQVLKHLMLGEADFEMIETDTRAALAEANQ